MEYRYIFFLSLNKERIIIKKKDISSYAHINFQILCTVNPVYFLKKKKKKKKKKILIYIFIINFKIFVIFNLFNLKKSRGKIGEMLGAAAETAKGMVSRIRGLNFF